MKIMKYMLDKGIFYKDIKKDRDLTLSSDNLRIYSILKMLYEYFV